MADDDKKDWWKRWVKDDKNVTFRKKAPLEDRIEWIEHKGRLILKHDLSDLSDKEFAEQMLKYEKIILEKSEPDLRVFSDVSNSSPGQETLMQVKRIDTVTRPFISKYAAVGVSGIKHLFVKAVKPFVSAKLEVFQTTDEAKNWLVSK